MLVMVDHPTGEKFYGSQVAAPICVNVLSDVLPYVGIFLSMTKASLQTCRYQYLAFSIILLRKPKDT